MPKQITGLVLGKFLPPHIGHKYLLDFANSRVDRLIIVVDNIADEIIPVSKRMEWMQALFPDAIVLSPLKELPQSPDECPDDFWQLWRDGLVAILKDINVDYVFASEEYGYNLAQILGAEFVMCDLERHNVPICATDIRANALKNWDYITDVAKPYFTKKICVFGPESTGKSTLTEMLARHYNAPFVPEFARDVIEAKNGKLEYTDMETIVKGHHQNIQKANAAGPKILFVDTDAIASKIWSVELFGKYSDVIDKAISAQDFDLYLLLDVDVPWVDDIVRYLPENRRDFFDKCKEQLTYYGKKFVSVSGSWAERFDCAVHEINAFLKGESHD